MWTNLGWFIYQLEVWFWSSAAWPKTSRTWAFPRCIIVFFVWRTVTIVVSKLNKPPVSDKPAPSPSNGLEINKPPGELNRGFKVNHAKENLYETATFVSSGCHPRPKNWSTYVLFFTSFKWRAWSVYFAFLDCWWQWNAKIKWKTESFSIFETKLLQFGVKDNYYVTIDCVGFVFSDLLLGAHFLISLRESI